MSNTKRLIFVTVALLLVAAAAFFAIRSYVFKRLDVSIQQRLTSLSLSGFNVHYDSLSVDWWDNVIKVDNLVLEKDAYDTTCIYPEFISVKRVRAEGIGLLQLVFRNRLSLESIYLDGSRVVLRENSLLKLDSTTQKDQEFSLAVEHVHLRAAHLTYTDSAHCDIITAVQGDISIAGLKMDFETDRPFNYGAEILTLQQGKVQMPKQSYDFEVYQASMNFQKSDFNLDTLRIIPMYGRIAFGQKYGFEIDRFEGIVPFIKARDFSFSFIDTAWVQARSWDMQFYLKVFRDKRLPFRATKKLLPVALLQDLPFALAIDSLTITKSFAQYEEYAEGADEAGRIFFDNLYARLLNVNNTTRKGTLQLTASSNLLGHGDLDLYATFPLEVSKRSSVAGSIQNFSIPEINPMLTPSTRIKVESGEMNKLSFQFTYNEIHSDGEIELNYENLKLVSFKDADKTEGDELEKDNLKTFIMNTFIFRKNMDEGVPDEKRTGTIHYQRDDARSVFNFWVKSLLSGIKSAYNLDKVAEKQDEKELKKEERSLRKEARREKRAEKKKARTEQG